METVNLVLTVSLVAHLICWPYQVLTTGCEDDRGLTLNTP